MPAQFIAGAPALKLLTSDLTKVDRTLALPLPSRGGLQFAWKKKAVRQELVDGRETERVLGYVPTLKLKWSVYDDVSPSPQALGGLDGNLAGFQDFLEALAGASIPGQLLVSPGPAPYGWTSVQGQGFGVGDGVTAAFQLQANAGAMRTRYGLLFPVASTPRTNLTIRSLEPTNASWAKVNSGTGSLPVLSANSPLAPAPDGTYTACRVQLVQGAGATSLDYCLLEAPSSSVLTGLPYTGSVFLRTVDGSSRSVYLVLSATSGTYSSIVTVTGAWRRFVMPSTATATAGARVFIGVRGTFTPGGSTADLLVWQAQVEPGSVATEPIVTSASVLTVNPVFQPVGASPTAPATVDGFRALTLAQLQGLPNLFLAASATATPAAIALGTDYSLDPTGQVVMTPTPASGAVLTWSGAFALPRVGFATTVSKFPAADSLAGGLRGAVEVEFTGTQVYTAPRLGVF